MNIKSLFFIVSFFCASMSVNAQAVMLNTAQSKFLEVGDVRLHYKSYGKGDVVILLHGAMEYWREWKNQIPDLTKKGFNVIVLDTRGHGLSSYSDTKITYDLLTKDLLIFINKLNVEKPHLVGFGDGGIIALKAALTQPDRIGKIAIIGTNAQADTNAVFPEVFQKVREWDLDKMTFYLQMKFKENPNPKRLKDFAQQMQQLLLNEPNISESELKSIKNQTLIMVGDNDFIKQSHTNSLFSLIPNVYLSIIPAASHYAIKERPKIVNAALIDFLSNSYSKPKKY